MTLNKQQLACGYVQSFGKDIIVRLWNEHCCYHVRVYDHNNKERLSWESFNTLTKARKAFASWKRTIKKLYPAGVQS